MNIPDHPEIARTLATGYPRRLKTVRCTCCYAEFSGDHRLYSFGGETLCASCFRESLLANTDTDELAEAFDIPIIMAAEVC